MTTALLIAEAVKKAAVAWIGGRPLWCTPVGDALATVVGPGEQPDPGLTAPTVPVTLRGDHGGAIVTFPATVTRLEPGGERWDEVVPTLTQKRLNLPGTDDTLARWASECAVYTLTPPVEAAADA